MTISSKALVELILLGPIGDRRQLQDSPVLGDVWMAYALEPSKAHDLLITPDWHRPTGQVAAKLAQRLRDPAKGRRESENKRAAANVAYLEGLVAAELTFREVLETVVPMTAWWQDATRQKKLRDYSAEGRLRNVVTAILCWVQAIDNEDEQQLLTRDFAKFSALDRYVALAAIILWAGDEAQSEIAAAKAGRKSSGRTQTTRRTKPQGLQVLTKLIDASGKKQFSVDPEPVITLVQRLFDEMIKRSEQEDEKLEPLVYQISLNRKATPALEKSVAAVKGDAARQVFQVKCDSIGWAVLDSGIDSKHKAFEGADGESRVKAAYDFSNIRKIVSLDNLDDGRLDGHIDELLQSRPDLDKATARKDLKVLADDAENSRPIQWELVEKYIKINSPVMPSSSHGTHVAGIIGARRPVENDVAGDIQNGMCPDIWLYDFRVLSDTVRNTEFAIIAALQFIRFLNNRQGFRRIHGANLSLSIPHDVRNFACGRTPICEECRRLVDDGTVVVAAAGNLGYHSFETKSGSYDGYTAFSITDPGNAEDVITVGATHRYWPHTYGISFFSSRGPTGDGRMKPDLVAPGERIQSALPDGEWGPMDGTSMAAPHVSGAAAMLMARYSELVGRPRRVKALLCESATDLGRERTFQGHGMLDILRAFQKT